MTIFLLPAGADNGFRQVSFVAVRRLQGIAGADHRKIAIIYHTVPLMLNLDTVTALGLVVSEVIAKGYAHAFPDGTGSINVCLSSKHTNDSATITFKDNGVGFVESGKSGTTA
jgi:two-component sensor histidine kinase